MRIAEFETATPLTTDASLPLRLEQKAPTLGPAVLLTLLIPLAILLLAPLATIALQMVTEPAGRASLVAQPALALQLTIGLALAALLVGWPVRVLLDRIGRQRIVLLDHQLVHVTDRGLFGTHTWSQPLSTYVGLTHHVRTTHAGVRNELILVHSHRDASVLLGLALRITDSEISALANRLGVPIVSPDALYPYARLPSWSSPHRPPPAPLASLEI